MGLYVAASDGAGTGAASPKNRTHHNRHGSASGASPRTRGTSRYSKVMAVLGLATLAGCTTITLQFMASTRSGAMHAENPAPSSTGTPVTPPILGDISGKPATLREAPPAGENWVAYADAAGLQVRPIAARLDTNIGSPVVPEYPVMPNVDRRFTGQKTGRPPKTDEEFYSPPPHRGPWGFGVDWAVGVSVEHEGSDVVEPPCCRDAPANRSFVEHVMERRDLAAVDPFNRVASCVRTKDNGRYLPEWVAYHWALGVDEFVVLDDQSIDDTREVLEPFIRAGILKFRQRSTRNATDRIETLNECVQQYRQMHDAGDRTAPRWVVLIDSDEYMWAGDFLSTLADVFGTYSSKCSLLVPTIKHGSSGFSEAPRGLVIENYLNHADPRDAEASGFPKVVVNLRPAEESAGTFQRLTSPHATEGCPSDTAPVSELAVRHYSMTLEDYKFKTRRYWTGQPELPTDHEIEEAFAKRDFNDRSGKDMLLWSCIVRHVLSRAATGKHMRTGMPFPSLSPHHPTVHGMRPIDPYGDQEMARTAACTSAVRASPTAAGTVWGNSNRPPSWLEYFCGTRYVFVHSFQGSGGTDVVRMLAAHEWVSTHTGKPAVSFGGAGLTSMIPTATELQGTRGKDFNELCGCSRQDSPGCWRYCPHLQQSLLAPTKVNKARRQLAQDWLIRFNFESVPGKPMVLVERDADMLLAAKQRLFPFVSTSVVTVRHPVCTPAISGSTRRRDMVAGLSEWRRVWGQVLLDQVPDVTGDVWVVRFEDMLAQEEEVASALWAAVGLPPISPYPPIPTAASPPLAAGEPAFLARTFESHFEGNSEPSGRGYRGSVEEPDRSTRTDRNSVEEESERPDQTYRNTVEEESERSDRTDRNSAEKNGTSERNDRNSGEEPDRSEPRDRYSVQESKRSERREQESVEDPDVPLPPTGAGDESGEGVVEVAERDAGRVGNLRRRRLIAGDALSKASGEVRNRAIPPTCRARLVKCEEDPACLQELQRCAVLLEFFGYGGAGEVLNSQRFLWGKEELSWLGKRLAAASGDPPTPPPLIEDGSDSAHEESVILPQAYAV